MIDPFGPVISTDGRVDSSSDDAEQEGGPFVPSSPVGVPGIPAGVAFVTPPLAAPTPAAGEAGLVL